MESMQLIKNRIHGIGGTRQITQSMRLVSTAKVQKARARMSANRPFWEELRQLAMDAARGLRFTRHPYLTERPAKCSAVVMISGDRGLCGGYNINVGRETSALLERVGESQIVTVGTKSRDYCNRRHRDKVAHSVTGISETPFFDDIREIASLLLGWYDSGEVDRIYVVYTQFKTMLSQTPKAELLLPIAVDESKPKAVAVRCEPEDESFLQRVVPFYVTSFLYGAILESSACEQSARIASMDSAAKNADEMIRSLTLRYNQARQGAITQEIIEIVGGANAVQ